MKNKDQLLLEQAYQQIKINEAMANVSRDELLQKMSQYADTQDPETQEYSEEDAQELLDWARAHGGDELVQHFIKHSEISHWGRPNKAKGVDPLRGGAARVTQSGKLHQQDVKARLNAGPRRSGPSAPLP
jgi:hypothetical protein